MGQMVKTFQDGSFVEYGKGSFDEWCVYLTDIGGERKPLKDVEYFQQLTNIAEKYGKDRVYKDFVDIYDKTGKKIDEKVLKHITEVASTYAGNELLMDQLLSILYMTMIAEENKRNTRLGKRIKRLGVHVLLLEGKPVYEAAYFLNGKKWHEIDVLCKERDF